MELLQSQPTAAHRRVTSGVRCDSCAVGKKGCWIEVGGNSCSRCDGTKKQCRLGGLPMPIQTTKNYSGPPMETRENPNPQQRDTTTRVDNLTFKAHNPSLQSSTSNTAAAPLHVHHSTGMMEPRGQHGTAPRARLGLDQSGPERPIREALHTPQPPKRMIVKLPVTLGYAEPFWVREERLAAEAALNDPLRYVCTDSTSTKATVHTPTNTPRQDSRQSEGSCSLPHILCCNLVQLQDSGTLSDEPQQKLAGWTLQYSGTEPSRLWDDEDDAHGNLWGSFPIMIATVVRNRMKPTQESATKVIYGTKSFTEGRSVELRPDVRRPDPPMVTEGGSALYRSGGARQDQACLVRMDSGIEAYCNFHHTQYTVYRFRYQPPNTPSELYQVEYEDDSSEMEHNISHLEKSGMHSYPYGSQIESLAEQIWSVGDEYRGDKQWMFQHLNMSPDCGSSLPIGRSDLVSNPLQPAPYLGPFDNEIHAIPPLLNPDRCAASDPAERMVSRFEVFERSSELPLDLGGENSPGLHSILPGTFQAPPASTVSFVPPLANNIALRQDSKGKQIAPHQPQTPTNFHAQQRGPLDYCDFGEGDQIQKPIHKSKGDKSCEACAKGKKRCGRELPRCKACVQKDRVCEYKSGGQEHPSSYHDFWATFTPQGNDASEGA